VDGGGTARGPRPSATVDLRPPRTLVVGPVTILLVALAFLLVGGWAALATGVLIFGDKLSAQLIAQQSDMQYAYEQKLVVFRAQLDRFAQQARFERDGVEGRVADLMLRQAALEARQAMLTALAEQIRGPGGTRFAEAVPAGAAPRAAAQAQAFAVLDASHAIEARVDHIQRSVDRIDGAQVQTLERFVRRSESVLLDLQGAFKEVGLSPEKFGGGPQDARASVANLLPGLGPGSAFETGFVQARRTLAALGRLRTAASAVPFGRPVGDEAEQTSSYGYRADPFTREQRFHAGLDFRAAPGTPVYAAGSGVVSSAGDGGGYGNLVIIDHGNNLTTRYAHLLAIKVSPGQPVSPGMLIGTVGSTGRSTGPHLHYETRIGGEPEDPRRFLVAGAQITASR
jgi:murein DD-endopeptidase MepM/ murein hydrolase activator NlpD